MTQKLVSTNDFVVKVAFGEMMVLSNQLALDRQPDADTKHFAERMVKDLQSKELRALVDGGKVKVSLPTGLDAEDQKKLDELKVRPGKEFDRAYDQMQFQAHEDAVALFSEFALSGDNPDLKSWTARTLPHLREHLEMAKKPSGADISSRVWDGRERELPAAVLGETWSCGHASH